MPRPIREIGSFLDGLAHCTADDLESQDLHFMEWGTNTPRQSVRAVVTAAVCMANGGGGTVVVGVADNRAGRACAILGVPPEVSVNHLKLAVHDGTDPTLTPVFEGLLVPEGTGRLIVMHVHPGIPPYTDTAGRGTVRVGSDCKPLTGTMRRKLLEESGENDYTAVAIDAPLPRLVSAAAMETLREAAKLDRAPADLLRLGDIDLLQAIGVIRDGKPTRAAILLAGSPDAVRDHVPNFLWTHLRMSSNTDYSDRADGRHAIPVALFRLMDRIMADNPIETVRRGLYHFEYRTYPKTALREALLNALCHGDFRVAGPRLVTQYADRIEISNPGGLIGDITPDNILHHHACGAESMSRPILGAAPPGESRQPRNGTHLQCASDGGEAAARDRGGRRSDPVDVSGLRHFASVPRLRGRRRAKGDRSPARTSCCFCNTWFTTVRSTRSPHRGSASAGSEPSLQFWHGWNRSWDTSNTEAAVQECIGHYRPSPMPGWHPRTTFARNRRSSSGRT